MRSIHSPPFAERSRRRGGVAIAVAIAALAPGPLRAQAPEQPAVATPPDGGDVDPEARRLGDRGLAHYEAGRYAEAIDDLQASYRITPAPGLLYNLAQAHRLKGDCAAARTFYRRFLAENPGGNVRQLTEARLAETERCAVASTAEPPPPASPLPELKHAPPADASGTLGLGKTTEPGPVPRREVGRRVAIGAGAAALGLAVASAFYGRRAQQASADVSAIADRGGVWGTDAMAREKSGHADERTALWLGAGALVSAGISLWLALRK